MGAGRKRKFELFGLGAFLVFALTVVASGWDAGWPDDTTPMQGWAMAIAIPAFLVGLICTIASSGRDSASENQDSDAAGRSGASEELHGPKRA